MADTIANEDNVSLKVVVHKERKRVIFAEADSNFIDILFSFMTLPMGTIVRLLGKCPDENLKDLGCLTNLYKSLIGLPENYLSTEESRFMLLNPRSSSYDHHRKLKINVDDTDLTKMFFCQNVACSQRLRLYCSSCDVARCSSCGKLMDWVLKYEGSTEVACFDGGVFVFDLITFIVTDDLRVMPNTSGVSIQLLCDFGVTDASQLEEITFDIGHEQILFLLNSALLLKYPLTRLVFPRLHQIPCSVNLKEGLSVEHLVSNEIKENAKKMTLKVILQKSTSKFLFAEAEDDFVDFVFGFMEIPLGTLVGKLMNGSSSLDSLDNLFQSISDMRVGKHIKSKDLKDMLLKPQLVQKYLSNFSWVFPKFQLTQQCRGANIISSKMKGRRATKYFKNFKLNDLMVHERLLKSPAKFMVTDDLVITPFSSLSVIALLNKLKVSFSDTEEHELSIGIEEGLKILKASLLSCSTLSDALLKAKGNSQDKAGWFSKSTLSTPPTTDTDILTTIMEDDNDDEGVREDADDGEDVEDEEVQDVDYGIDLEDEDVEDEVQDVDDGIDLEDEDVEDEVQDADDGIDLEDEDVEDADDGEGVEDDEVQDADDAEDEAMVDAFNRRRAR